MVFAAFRAPGRRRGSRTTRLREVVGQLEKTGCIADYTHIWWDIRLHPRLGTIEIRICDASRDSSTSSRSSRTARRSSSSSRSASSAASDSVLPSHSHHREQVAGRPVRARSAADGSATGRRNRIPVAQLIRRTLKELEPHARELGSERELEGIEEILRNGNGADRQLRVFNANRDIVEVVSEIADATEAAAETQLAQ
jgi:carboxylate-amine ligase